MSKVLKQIFGDDKTAISLFYVPTYPTGMWSFQWGIKGDINHPSDIDKDKIFETIKGLDLNYNEDIHHSSFALPNFVKNY